MLLTVPVLAELLSISVRVVAEPLSLAASENNAVNETEKGAQHGSGKTDEAGKDTEK